MLELQGKEGPRRGGREGGVMITMAGPQCDVCGNYILLDKSINPFTVKGIDGKLHCHDKCKLAVETAFGQKSWELLPEGPLKVAFRENYKREK